MSDYFRFLFAIVSPEQPGVKRLDFGLRGFYALHMKRTNLVLDAQLLEEAVRLSGERTYSRTVERALADFVRRIKAGRILELAGSGLWQGDLSQMRGDAPKRRPRAATHAAR